MNSLCCMRLNTAAVLTGWIGAVVSLISIVILSIILAVLDTAVEIVIAELHLIEASEDHVRGLMIFIGTVCISILCINLSASALLIVGTIKENHLLLLPWLFNTSISLIIMLYLAVSAMISTQLITVTLIVTGSGFLVHFYVWNSVYALYKKLQANIDKKEEINRISTRGLNVLPRSVASIPSGNFFSV